MTKQALHALFARLSRSFKPSRSILMHRYRTHTCGALRDSDIGKDVRLSGWCHRIRDHGGVLFIDLRDHYGLTQVVADPDQPGLQGRRDAARRMGGADRRQGAHAPGRHRERRPADRRGRGLHHRDRGAGAGRRTADAGVRRPGISGGDPAQVPLPRPAPRQAAPQHHDARPGHRLDPPAHEGAGLLRIPDADPDRVVAGRRARLPGAVAHPSGQVLRAAAGAAAVQAAHHDRRASTAISRSRRASATRTRAPTARPASSTSSISR